MRTILLFTFGLSLWAQTNPASPKPDPQGLPPANPVPAKVDPVSKTNVVPQEPGAACAGDRSELLDYPNFARASAVEAIVLAEYTVTPEGKLKDLKLSNTVENPEQGKLFEKVIQTYLQQSTYPPGCEKDPKQVQFEFLIKGEPAAERKILIEFKAPNTYQIWVNPEKPAPPPSADRTKK